VKKRKKKYIEVESLKKEILTINYTVEIIHTKATFYHHHHQATAQIYNENGTKIAKIYR
jgi:hypothetical protein